MAVVKLKRVWQMLDDCAAGHSKTANQEYWTIRYGGKTFRKFPTGAHGNRRNPEVERGHVKAMVRHFLLPADCVARHIHFT